ncbi:MAG: HAMP domain-containing histidine kinase [Anaerolineae bacterium]|nr:HAMP domain-containing histidine kinase [Anaerolineae bacterium]
MKAAAFPRIVFANRRSIRWRLPWSYAGIAILTALALGGLLLFTLNRYYTRLETQYLEMNAHGLARQVDLMYHDGLTTEDIQSAVSLFSFLTRARVQLYDPEMMLVADSGPASEQLQINFGFGQRTPDRIGGSGGATRAIGPFLIMRADAATTPLDYTAATLIEGAAATGTTSSNLLIGPSPLEGQATTTLQGSIGVPVTEAPGESALPEGEQGIGRYLVPIQRGPFGQIALETAVPGSFSSARVSMPVHDASGTLLAYVELSEGPAFGSEIVRAVAENSLLAGGIALLIAALVGILMSRNISRPALALAVVAREMEQGNLAVRSGVQRRDEFGVLAEAFNAMATRIETTIATLRQFVADAAHEINTPLTALRTNLELTTTSDIPDSARSDVQKALAELSRLDALTSNLLTLTRLENPLVANPRTPVDLTGLVRQMHERHASRAEQAAINLSVEAPDEPVVIQADPAQMSRVLDNLLDNALKFTPGGGEIILGLSAGGGLARLWVQDTGIGIPAGDLARLFSRFHRGRNAAAFPGNGLGLSIVRAIVDDHDGHIEVTSDEGGTCFTVGLPLIQRQGRDKERES